MKKLSLFLCLISLSVASLCSATRWHDAAETGNLDELQRLIETEPQNINQTNNGGNTPLHRAAYRGSESAIRILLENGALDVINRTDKRGNTPLHWAAIKGSESALRILFEHGALDVINQNNNYGNTPLHWAAIGGSESTLRILLENGALDVINQTDSVGETPLHRAAYSGSESAKELLRFCQTLKERAPKEIFEFLKAMKRRTNLDSQEPLPNLPPEMLLHIYKCVKHPSLPIN